MPERQKKWMEALRKRERKNLSSIGRKYIRWKAMPEECGRESNALQIERASQVKCMDNINVQDTRKQSMSEEIFVGTLTLGKPLI